jgi:DedD protein
VIAVGAFTNPDAVIAKLAGANLPYYTEPVKGNLTRVRAGPFASKEAADQAYDKLKALGLKPGAVTPKPG